MAHRSKKKHIKHVHEHEPAKPRAKSPIAKANRERARIGEPPEPRPKKRGLVRRAAKKLAAKPRRMAKRAVARVRSMIGV